VTSGAELVANDAPLLVHYDDAYYFPVFVSYPETTFGGFLPTEADYQAPEVTREIRADGWMLWPPVPFQYDTIIRDLANPAPSAPSTRNWLGTDDNGRDVLARLIYGFRISVVFGLLLTIASTVIGVAVGAVQGYFGGRVDLYGQRFIEIWAGMPELYVLIILSSVIQPDFWWLLFILLLFSWSRLVQVVAGANP